MGLEEEFTQALEVTIEAAKARSYVPTYFMQMLGEHGGRETAKRLLAKSAPQTGLFELWNLGLLRDSMEAVICDHPRFHTLFEDDELAEARRRLDELGYFKGT
jgi:predicted ATPase